MALVLALCVSFVACEVAALRHWNGTWRVVAMVPGVAFLIVVALILIGGFLDPTSHNLWPFEILIWSGIGLATLGLLSIFRLAVGCR